MLSVTDWKPSETTFRWPTKANPQRKFAFINKSMNESKKIELQLTNSEKPSEYLWMPFNLSEPMIPTGNGENERLTMEVAITDPSIGAKFLAMDEACMAFAGRESTNCFGKEVDKAVIQDRFTSPYRPTDVEGKSSLLRLKLSADRVNILRLVDVDEATGKVRCKRGSVGLLTRGCHIAPKVEVPPLWFITGGAFGYSLQVTDVIVDTSSSLNGGSTTHPFLMKEGFELEVLPDDDEDVKGANIPTTADEPPLKRCNVMQGIDASLETDSESVIVNPSAYL